MAHRLTRRERARDGDRGYTLVEVVVAMGIFSVFLAVFIAGVVTVSRASTQAKVDAQTSSSTGIALQRIERTARYADAVNQPGLSGDVAYVEWRTDAISAPSGVTTCTQLRYRPTDGTIAMRTWPATQDPALGKWNVLTSSVQGAASATYPFATVLAASGVSNYQGLTVHIKAGLDDRVGTDISTTVYAKNSSVESPSNIVGPDGQSLSPVCAGSGSRP